MRSAFPRSSRAALPGLLLALALGACSEEPAPEAPPPPPSAKKPAAAAAAGAADGGTDAPAPYVYGYMPVGKRDPFRSPVEEFRAAGDTGSNECREPLCGWDVDQLVLVATVTSDANPFGMLEDPSGKGHVVYKNFPVGKLQGKVTQVLRDCIAVTEQMPSPDGRRIPVVRQLCVKADRGSGTDLDLGSGKVVGP
ncbi:MAG: pilus assembly protein PilP [Deltaproteobacteria bacterium]|nr:pilus assembly protein PilP [Deltaproteobacteria bacterium]